MLCIIASTLGLFLRPKRRLNGARSFVLQVGHDPGPVQNAAFSSRQLPLGFFELAFGMTHALALDWIEFPVNRHTRFQVYRLRLLRPSLSPSGCSKARSIVCVSDRF
jgi:hypothetical protein